MASATGNTFYRIIYCIFTFCAKTAPEDFVKYYTGFDFFIFSNVFTFIGLGVVGFGLLLANLINFNPNID